MSTAADLHSAPAEAGNGGEERVELLTIVIGALLKRNHQLETALESRDRVEQATGILAERYGLELENALDLLRWTARCHGRKLHELAGEVVTSPTTPHEIRRHFFRRNGGAAG